MSIRPRRAKVQLELYQLAEIYPDDPHYRVRCRLCGLSRGWINHEAALDWLADHLAERHQATGGKRPVKRAKSTAT